MKNSFEAEEQFRLWVREVLKNVLGDDPDAPHRFSFPVKRLLQIAIEEIYFHLMRNNVRAPQKTAADILEIDPKTVSRTINNYSE